MTTLARPSSPVVADAQHPAPYAQLSPLHWSVRTRVGAVLGLALVLWALVGWAVLGGGLPH